jgi:hypothetical protein
MARKRLENSLDVLRVVIAVPVVLSACATTENTDFERIEITCEESAIQISIPTLPGQGECIKWQHYLHGSTFSEGARQYHRFERFEGGFINVRYLEAGPKKRFSYLEFDQELDAFFRRVREDASNLTDRYIVDAGDREFQVARFDLPDDRRCVGFLSRWLVVYEGWKHKIVGYACGIGTPLDETRIAFILAGIEIRPVEPVDRPLTTTSGAFPFEAVFTSAVYKTDDGQELADALDEVALDHGVIYLYIKWRGLSLSDHRADLSISDGAGREVHSTYLTFIPTKNRWNNWWYYRIDAEKDAPGKWTFTVMLDGELVLRKHLTVHPE